jgi:3-methyladenine DNA glycosylase AlkD
VAADRTLIDGVRADLRGIADPLRAPQMQAYMKSDMPFLGVPVPVVRRIVRSRAKANPPATTGNLVATAAVLWRTASYREERYAATALTGVPAAAPLQTLDMLPLYQEMITSGAWWDHVDEVAHRLGPLLLAYPDQMRPTVERWAREPDRWMRRAAIICQLDAKRATDVDLLSDAISVSLGDRDFFIRKAIGWALRQYARTDPQWVRRFVAEHADRLSALSRREALKHVNRS